MKKNNLVTIFLFLSVITYTNTTQNNNTESDKVKLGKEAKDTGDKSIAIGYKAEAEKKESISIGVESKAKADTSIAIGKGANTGKINSNDATNAISIGTDSEANSKSAIAIGEKANANTTDSIAIGKKTYTDGQGAIAIGGESKANSSGISLGKKALSHNKGISIGEETESQLNGVVIGNRAKSKGNHSENNVAIGSDSNVGDDLFGVTALGSNSKVEEDNSVALGSYSVAKRREDRLGYDALTNENVSLEDKLTEEDKEKYHKLEQEIKELLEKQMPEGNVVNGKQENYKKIKNSTEIYKKYQEYSKIAMAWKSHYGEVSVGDTDKGITRQITGVAAGSKDTDAVNVAQLKSLHKYVDKLGSNTISFSGDSGKTEAQALNKSGGLDFSIKGTENITTIAKDNTVTVDLSDKVKSDISKGVAANSGIANAVAMANLPQISGVGHNIAGSYGYYNGEHAFALGLSGRSEAFNLTYRASGSLNTRGNVALGAGLGYQFDSVSSRSKELLTLQRNGNINLLDEKVYEHELKIKLFEKELKELKNENIENNKKILQLIERIVKLEKNK
ncbi:adhesin [Streptobacillus moniliformis]|uniref:YadA domain protein n=2 Tax=Streptobacillus moniliformis TaxID=34105 RepID=D1AVM6_STRM9|nr:YadA-like family protein [Streptobacillus moniliformis]ACZ01786.1 YadA domain protein [Streptobacillus moniliformis DSM 12112]AVL43219.1 adhesin [Streptobacillus moniliformis]SQA13018.1 Hep_Hag [Streptobacillus moniliformis]